MNRSFARKDSVAANMWKGFNISFQIKNTQHSPGAFREIKSKPCSQKRSITGDILQTSPERLLRPEAWTRPSPEVHPASTILCVCDSI